MKYIELIEELKANNIKAKNGEFYIYEGLPKDWVFDFFWGYSQDFLERKDLGFSFEYPRIYFNTTTDTNAIAYLEDKYSIVEINKGTIFQWHNFFANKKEFFNSGSLSQYKVVADRFEITSDFFMFQFVSMYFLYHETGHLIQRNKATSSYVEFMVNNCTDVNQIKDSHVREFDADWFAANQLAIDIAGLNKNLHGEFDTPEKVEFLHLSAELVLAAIYIFLIWVTDMIPEIYYEEKCHPHPSVRLTYMIFYLIDTLRLNVSVELNQDRILRNAISACKELMKDATPNPIDQYSLNMYESLDKIEAYTRQLIANCKPYIESSRNKLAMK